MLRRTIPIIWGNPPVPLPKDLLQNEHHCDVYDLFHLNRIDVWEHLKKERAIMTKLQYTHSDVFYFSDLDYWQRVVNILEQDLTRNHLCLTARIQEMRIINEKLALGTSKIPQVWVPYDDYNDLIIAML